MHLGDSGDQAVKNFDCMAWKMSPWWEVKRKLSKVYGVKLLKPKRYMVALTCYHPSVYKDMSEHMGMHCSDAFNIAYKDTRGKEPRIQQNVSSQLCFNRAFIPMLCISHECSHAASDFLFNVRKCNPGMLKVHAEEVRAYSHAWLVYNVDRIVRKNRVRTKQIALAEGY